MDTYASAKNVGDSIEKYLRNYCHSELKNQETLLKLFDYSLSDIGIRIRPFLFSISSEEGGPPLEEIIPIATGIELIQLSTLVIDDILDESMLRNNEPSIYSKYGSKISICIGTIISTLGFCLISDEIKNNKKIHNGVDILHLFSKVHKDIYIGQFLDLSFEKLVTLSEDLYYDMISKTTAQFIQASFVAGAMLWDMKKETIKMLEQAGLSLGMAYQIRDDVIDIIGDSDFIGKLVGGDIKRCKTRLPIIQAIKKLNGDKQKKLIDLMHRGTLTDNELNEALTLVKESSAVDYCISKVKEYCIKAVECINMLPEKYTGLKKKFCCIAEWIAFFEE